MIGVPLLLTESELTQDNPERGAPARARGKLRFCNGASVREGSFTEFVGFSAEGLAKENDMLMICLPLFARSIAIILQ